MYNMQNIEYDGKRVFTQEHGDLIMNDNVIGFLQDECCIDEVKSDTCNDSINN